MTHRNVIVTILFSGLRSLALWTGARANQPTSSLGQRLDRRVLDWYPDANEPGAQGDVTATFD